MPKTYTECGKDVYLLANKLIHDKRADLKELLSGSKEWAPRIFYRFIFSGNDNPPMTRNGMILRGTCEKASSKDRNAGKADIVITLDGKWYQAVPQRRKEALLYHEIMHIDHYDGETDDDGKPILTTRPGDWSFDGFDDVMAEYGEDSLEWTNLQRASGATQPTLPFPKDEEAA